MQKQPTEPTVLKKFVIFTGKHLCWSLFFNKVAGLQKKNLRTQIVQNLRKQLLLYPTRSITLGIAANQENVSPFVTNAPRGFLMFSGGRERVNWEQMRYKTNMIEQTFFFFFFIVTFTLHLNVKNLQSPGNLNWYITWENKKWIKNLI